VVDASRSDVARFMAYLLSGDRYAVADHHRKVALPSASTRKSTLACLHSFYKYLLTVDVVKHDPTTGVDRPKVKTKPGFRLSAEELRKLLDAPGAPRCKIQVYLIDDDLSADAVGALAEAYEAATGERITSEFHEA
jgi:site-specific recombinase XerD